MLFNIILNLFHILGVRGNKPIYASLYTVKGQMKAKKKIVGKRKWMKERKDFGKDKKIVNN